MATAPDSLVGESIEWTGVHHSDVGDFADLSTHVVSYVTGDRCFVTAAGKLVGEATYTYKKLDDRMSVLIYRPELYQGRSNVVLYAMLDFEQQRDRAVILAAEEPLAVAEGKMREVPTPTRENPR